MTVGVVIYRQGTGQSTQILHSTFWIVATLWYITQQISSEVHCPDHHSSNQVRVHYSLVINRYLFISQNALGKPWSPATSPGYLGFERAAESQVVSCLVWLRPPDPCCGSKADYSSGEENKVFSIYLTNRVDFPPVTELVLRYVVMGQDEVVIPPPGPIPNPLK